MTLLQNICNEAVYYSELLKRKIERGHLGPDHTNLIVQVRLVYVCAWLLVLSNCQHRILLMLQHFQQCIVMPLS